MPAHLQARRVWTRPRAAERPYASSQPSCCPLHAPRTQRAREARPTSAGTRWRWSWWRWGAWSRTCRRVSLHLRKCGKQVWVEGSARLLCGHFYMLKSKALLIELVSQIQFGQIVFRRHWRQEYFSHLRVSQEFYSAVFSLMILFHLLFSLPKGF
jgi:hypothetical protein